jgi:hypothetical protein
MCYLNDKNIAQNPLVIKFLNLGGGVEPSIGASFGGVL